MGRWGERPSRHDPEVFADYESYLHSAMWPKDGVATEVEEMVPQHACAAHLKLVRWARTAPAGEVATIDDVDAREEFVRVSWLGRELAARALGLTESTMRALYGETGQGKGAEDREVLAALVVAMGEAYPQWSLSDRIKHGWTLTQDLTKHFIIRHRSS